MRFWIGMLTCFGGAALATIRLFTSSGWDMWWIAGLALFVIGLVILGIEGRGMRQWLDRKEEEFGSAHENQIAAARRIQEQTDEHLGKVLIELGFTGEREVLQAKAQRLGLPFVDLDRVQPDAEALDAVPHSILKEHRSIPVKLAGKILWVAMGDPASVVAADAIRDSSGCRVLPVAAVPSAIDEALKKLTSGD